MTEMGVQTIPLRALMISAGALAVPVATGFLPPDWLGDAGVLVWLTGLVPAFLMAYYKGWRGASVALAIGMTVLTLANLAIVVIGLPEPDWGVLLGVVVVFVATCLGLATIAELLHRARGEAERQALTDPLTGLPNRRHAMMVLEKFFGTAERGSSPVAAVIFDLDRFKEINDRYGHAHGDEVLIAFADVLKSCTRKADMSARFGGEEFLSLLMNTDEAGALSFAERVREGTKAATHPKEEVTVSSGVATYHVGMASADRLVVAADKALYAAKEGGRDQVASADRPAGASPTRVAQAEVGGAGGSSPDPPLSHRTLV